MVWFTPWKGRQFNRMTLWLPDVTDGWLRVSTPGQPMKWVEGNDLQLKIHDVGRHSRRVKYGHAIVVYDIHGRQQHVPLWMVDMRSPLDDALSDCRHEWEMNRVNSSDFPSS